MNDLPNDENYRLWRRQERGTVDHSLARQLQALTEAPADTTNGMSSVPPDTYLFTALSAIPIADAVRGFFAEKGEEPPLLSYIAANRSMSIVATPIPDGSYTCPSLEELQPAHDSEVERLSGLLGSKQHVCVVEEFVGSGRTLRYAGQLLTAAGVQAVSVVRGYWYHNSYEEDVDLKNLSSVHAQFMYEVGKQACRSVSS